MSNQESINRGLDRAYNELKPEDTIKCDIESVRIVIFSDHHRGVRDGADDFQRCEGAYCAALGYYLERGYNLIVLGDAEELWECRPAPVIRAYENTLKLEAEFYKNREDRYCRIYGNHDDYWRDTGSINIGGEQITARDKLMISLHDKNNKSIGDIFFVHGHQGTFESDRFGKISRFFVRNLWRPFQRITHIKLTTPAKDAELRGEHDTAMYNWALNKNNGQKKLLLIAGHTHLPVFASKDHIGKISDELKSLQQQLDNARTSGDPHVDGIAEQTAEKRAELEYRKAQKNMKEDQKGIFMEKPCYFNSGCCSFSDGDITGLEIADGKIKLVKWPKDNPRVEVLEDADLRSDIFGSL
ncbi:MAG TPA: metallophosphoesterase [Nitrospiraceae bacterium]|nr:MAG: hypothetical protein A2Z82_02800 [Nitrospirae bacterium GWA2_46_11]OGW25733.1 MAG: hypothetical protein A2X55_11535 [Nitrospirae bacterium GWB2_47_37]HAK87983.1 metallophosphoesterase [Nitrospiraceae bacterium]HCZ12803.1 metallophosphoesterase [Nitrospiraceae bacterium]